MATYTVSWGRTGSDDSQRSGIGYDNEHDAMAHVTRIMLSTGVPTTIVIVFPDGLTKEVTVNTL